MDNKINEIASNDLYLEKKLKESAISQDRLISYLKRIYVLTKNQEAE